jgi:hypothetical protein
MLTFLPQQFHYGTKMSHFFHNNSILEQKCHISSTTILFWNKNVTFLPQQFHFVKKMSHFFHNNSIMEQKCHISSTTIPLWNKNVTFLPYIFHHRLQCNNSFLYITLYRLRDHNSIHKTEKDVADCSPLTYL